jgi:hypothetical protein
VPDPCSICTSEHRDEIDRLLVVGSSMRAMAGRFGCGRSSLMRHKAAHLSPAIVQVAKEHEADRIVTLLDRVSRLVDAAESILKTAQDTGKASLALSAIREVRESLKLLGAASGELRDGPTVQILNVASSPDWIGMRTRLLMALEPWPEAKIAAAAALAPSLAAPLPNALARVPLSPYRPPEDAEDVFDA